MSKIRSAALRYYVPAAVIPDCSHHIIQRDAAILFHLFFFFSFFIQLANSRFFFFFGLGLSIEFCCFDTKINIFSMPKGVRYWQKYLVFCDFVYNDKTIFLLSVFVPCMSLDDLGLLWTPDYEAFHIFLFLFSGYDNSDRNSIFR